MSVQQFLHLEPYTYILALLCHMFILHHYLPFGFFYFSWLELDKYKIQSVLTFDANLLVYCHAVLLGV